MKQFLSGAAAFVLSVTAAFFSIYFWLYLSTPAYSDALGSVNHTEKITGLYLVRESAKRPDNVIVYGSSELRPMGVSSHPSVFFEGKRAGFQVNLVGRGSCQSLIHAMSIASSGESLTGKNVVLITSPQSYVEGGIAPDLFMANFSEQQYLALMRDPSVPEELKLRFSERVAELIGEYNEMTGAKLHETSASGLLAKAKAEGGGTALLAPYAAVESVLLDMRDLYTSRRLILNSGEEISAASTEPIDWDAEFLAADLEAAAMSTNNAFGMLNDYYQVNVGRNLAKFEGRDRDLNYTESEEYGDLELLLEVCRLKGVEPLFVHVPLHGPWSDYVGFTSERRHEYYGKVRELVSRYGVQLCDLTDREYEPYVLCDVMHLGWRGWLYVNRAICGYVEGN